MDAFLILFVVSCILIASSFCNWAIFSCLLTLLAYKNSWVAISPTFLTSVFVLFIIGWNNSCPVFSSNKFFSFSFLTCCKFFSVIFYELVILSMNSSGLISCDGLCLFIPISGWNVYSLGKNVEYTCLILFCLFFCITI